MWKILLCASLLLPASVHGADKLVDAANPEALLALARYFGPADLMVDEMGTPLMRGSMNGETYVLLFLGCKQGKHCSDIQFASSWPQSRVSLEQLNLWNRSMRYGRAYLDLEEDPVLEMTVNLQHGVSAGNLAEWFDWWRVTSAYFSQLVRPLQ